jgi:hypothetical protein
LDLPDVPTKAPVVHEVVSDDAEVSTKRKGLSLSLFLSPEVTFALLLMLDNFEKQLWKNHCQLDWEVDIDIDIVIIWSCFLTSMDHLLSEQHL